MIRFYNSLSHQTEELAPLVPGQIGLYTCGPTVYNFAHIGNFRCYAFEDLLKRTLAASGLKVKHVMNLTDVDDKTIRGSRAENLPLRQFTQRYKDAFHQDIHTLRIVPADVYPAATETIPEMIELIQKLFDKGLAYQADDKSVYFSIAKWPKYGQLVRLDRDNMRAGVRIKLDEYAKDSVADFALWKAWDEADGDVWWDSPWGRGRPGWHIECSAMSSKYLGPTFDIHCGGIDNMFPHHEDEIAQSESVTGKKWVNCWLHCEHLMVNNTKMSKSLGNFYTLRDLLEKGYTGREVRWVLIGTHYRKKLNFSLGALDQARETLSRFGAFFARMKAVTQAGDGSEVRELLDRTGEQFRAAVADDLNSAGAAAALFTLVRDGNRLADEGALSAAGAKAILEQCRDFDRIFGCLAVDEAPAAEAIPDEVAALAEERAQARKNRNWAESDRLRDAIKAAGYAVEDAPGGVWKLKKL